MRHTDEHPDHDAGARLAAYWRSAAADAGDAAREADACLASAGSGEHADAAELERALRHPGRGQLGRFALAAVNDLRREQTGQLGRRAADDHRASNPLTRGSTDP
ncbi:hypothetical protein MRQ36_31305 [Micromonospora sp. R77]|uniref:hypothetical protein n=1 Tax=Micromonospora sp. R77 TaxID=2925836 RepID=UPI001F61C264|nr:hypothetical protein [Micromonospora sp. R77]MCI4066809.1 hypothetical protein [Micromonospora sp. R77]